MVGFPCSPRGSQGFSPKPQLKRMNSSALSFLYSPNVTSVHDYRKNHSFDKIDLYWQMSLLFNMLSRLVIALLPRSKHLLISWLQSPSAVTICSDFGAQKDKVCHCFHFSPSICQEVMELDAMILVLLMLSFKPTFSLSSFTFIKRLFSSSSLSARRVVSSVYLRLLIFFPAILMPAYD